MEEITIHRLKRLADAERETMRRQRRFLLAAALPNKA
jgi:hypothetical protein